MRELIVEQNQVSYTGLYSRPPFQLWGEGSIILAGLCDAFAPFSVTLASVRVEGTGSQSPLDQAVNVAFGANGIYRFRFDKVESTFMNFSDEDLQKLPMILAAGESWLRKAVPELKFQSHQIQYGSHSRLSEGSTDEVMRRLVKADFEVPGDSLKVGAILKWTEPQTGWTLQMTVDYSQLIEDGLFLWFGVTLLTDNVNFTEFAVTARSLLENRLKELGLCFPRS